MLARYVVPVVFLRVHISDLCRQSSTPNDELVAQALQMTSLVMSMNQDVLTSAAAASVVSVVDAVVGGVNSSGTTLSAASGIPQTLLDIVSRLNVANAESVVSAHWQAAVSSSVTSQDRDGISDNSSSSSGGSSNSSSERGIESLRLPTRRLLTGADSSTSSGNWVHASVDRIGRAVSAGLTPGEPPVTLRSGNDGDGTKLTVRS